MSSAFSHKIFLGCILLSVVIGIVFYPQLPSMVVSHWNIRGEADGFMPKFFGVFLLPLVLIFLFVLSVAIPKIDPLKNNIVSFRKHYNLFWIGIAGFLLYLYTLTIFWNTGYHFSFNLVLTPGIAAFWWFVGGMLIHSKRNWFVGIRTPWTLSSDHVWKLTHERAGRLFRYAGAISLLGMILPAQLAVFSVLPAAGIALYSIGYSYAVYRRECRKKEE